MSTYFESKVESPKSSISPDIYDISIGGTPSDRFVVSRNLDGKPASFYGDFAWNMSAYDPELKTHWLRFNFWGKKDKSETRLYLIGEAKWITFALIWLRDGPTLSVRTLKGYLSVIKSLAQYADSSECQIRDVLTDTLRMISFLEADIKGKMLEPLGALVTALFKIGPERLGFQVIGKKLQDELRAKARKYRLSLKQTPPLPTRIYSAVISNLVRELDGWLAIKGDFIPLLTSCMQDHMLGRKKAHQWRISKRLGLSSSYKPEFEHIVPYSVKTYLNDRNMAISVKGLTKAVTEIQMALRLTIQAYTGMREDEAQSLPYHCLEKTTSSGKSHYVVLGRTTKLNNGRIKRTRWVTNHEGHRAIMIAQGIAKVIYAGCDAASQGYMSRIDHYPLFVSTGYLGLTSSQLPKNGKFVPGGFSLANYQILRARLEPLIEEGDLSELEQIDPHRAWRSEDAFQIGKPWTLTSHQLRRSLALYAQRSGLVSLPSLRRQLQHITEEMSRYYARGSAFARDFIGDNRQHFGREWQETQPISAGLSYMINVLLTDDVLFGGHANWVEHRLKNSKGNFLIDRATTMRKFKMGELAYRETLIGGCTKVGECGQAALQWLNIDCISIGCQHMVGNLTKLERVIAAQEKFVKSLDPESVEYRTEKADLNLLVATYNKILRQ